MLALYHYVVSDTPPVQPLMDPWTALTTDLGSAIYTLSEYVPSERHT
jgi:hypothetical protein